MLHETDKKYHPDRNLVVSGWSSWRHCDTKGNLVHVEGEGKCTNECVLVYHYDFHSSDILQVEISAGQQIEVPSFVEPLLAGRLSDGRRAYLARAHSPRGCGWMSFCSVAEGTKPEDAHPNSWMTGDPEIPDKVHLLALRYAPNSYPRRYGSEEFLAGVSDGIDATGPYSWKFIGKLSR